MDAANFRKMIQLSSGGADCLIGITYGDGSRSVFTEDLPFKESMIQGEFLFIEEEDLHGLPLQTFKYIGSIIAMTFCKNKKDRHKVDRYYLRN